MKAEEKAKEFYPPRPYAASRNGQPCINDLAEPERKAFLKGVEFAQQQDKTKVSFNASDYELSEEKAKTIQSIRQLILDEQRKHSTLDWAEIAARKIYSTFNQNKDDR